MGVYNQGQPHRNTVPIKSTCGIAVRFETINVNYNNYYNIILKLLIMNLRLKVQNSSS